MVKLNKHHATIFFPPEVSAPIEKLRREWDAAMSAQIAAHVTLCYPQEAADVELLERSLRKIASQTAPFRLRLGNVAFYKGPEKGIYIEVEDVDDGIARMRSELLQPPFSPFHEYVPHVTVIHPRTSNRGAEFWQKHTNAESPQSDFTAMETAITAFDGVKWQTVNRFLLGQSL